MIITTQEMQDLSDLIQTKRSIEIDLEAAEGQVKQLKKQLRQVEEVDIPELMLSAGVREVTTTDGWKLEMNNVWVGNISEAHRIAAFNWLRANGHGGLIKRQLKMDFNDDDSATNIKEMLKKEGLFPDDKETVHHQTLNAFIREQKENGAEIPDDLLSTYQVRKIKLKRK